MPKEFFRYSRLILFLTFFSATGLCQNSVLGKAEFNKILDLHWQKKEYRFAHASTEIQSDVVDLEGFTNSPVVPGTAFGAKASVIVNADIKDINNYYLKKEAYGDLHIPTFKEFVLVNAIQGGQKISVFADLVIKVPVIKDIPVKDGISFEKFDKYSWLEW